jgi:hypothetical protein
MKADRLRNRARDGAPVVAIHVPRSRDDEPLILALEPPRATALLRPPSRAAEVVAATGAGRARDDATFVLDGVASGRERTSLAPYASRLRGILPRAEVLAADPDGILKFLWSYRDRHDPMTLGHSSERSLFDESYDSRPHPRVRGAAGRGRQRRAIAEISQLLLEMGFALGVSPLLPSLPGAPGGSKALGSGGNRQSALIDATLAFYAGVLFRWGAPLAIKQQNPGGIPRVLLADGWLRRKLGLPPREAARRSSW